MLMLLTPAKALNFDPVDLDLKPTKPTLMKHATELVGLAQKLSRRDIVKLMGVSDQLADLNYERFQSFKTKSVPASAKPAALTFAGDVYRGLDANTLDAEDLAYAQDHLRILSGLYGLLRPLDAIQPYRLEMSRRLKNARGADLYAFWREVIAKEINKQTKPLSDPTVVSLASNEYAKAVDQSALDGPMVTFNFKEEKDGKARALMLFVKRARGLMARYAIQNRIEKVEDLKGFTVDGYKFRKDLSSDGEWIFTRPQPAKKAA